MIDNKDNENLYITIKLLDPFPDHVVFKDLRITQQNIKYSRGPFSLLEVIIILSSCYFVLERIVVLSGSQIGRATCRERV